MIFVNIKIEAPLTRDEARKLHAGDSVLISGTIYTARDAAHKRLTAMIERGEPLPFPIENSVIYYVGPTPAKEGEVIGSCGPTTSGRMDAYAPTLIALGETGMIGKGARNEDVVKAMKEHGAVYFAAIGGAGALLSSCVKESEVIAFPDLGAEAVRKLKVFEFPAIVVIDTEGKNAYNIERDKYKTE